MLLYDKIILAHFNPLSANLTKWLNILKQFMGNLLTNYLNMFGHFMEFSLKRAKCSNILKQFVGSLLTNCLSVFDHFM